MIQRFAFGLGKIFVLGLVLSAVMFTSCKDDEEPTPTTAKFSGVITIDNAEIWASWVDSGEVQLTFFPEFSLDPLAGWGAYPDNAFGPGVPGGVSPLGAPVNSQNPIILEYEQGRNQYQFEIEITNMTGPVTFSALAVGFRHDFVQDATRKTATLGVYWNNENEVSHGIVLRPAIGAPPIFDYPAPVAFTLDPGDEVTLNFKADFSFVEVWF